LTSLKMKTASPAPPATPSRLFARLIEALHDESDALVANDAAKLADAVSRDKHLLRLLAPGQRARTIRHGGDGELERFAREALQLKALAVDTPLPSSFRASNPACGSTVTLRVRRSPVPGRRARPASTSSSVWRAGVRPPGCAAGRRATR
jgi:hypothetical protein